MRYEGREVRTITPKTHPNLLKNRRRTFVRVYETPKWNSVTAEQKSTVSTDLRVWQWGDRFYKLALQYYGSAEDWWVIAVFNNRPTDFDVKVGDEILIPYPLHVIKELYGV